MERELLFENPTIDQRGKKCKRRGENMSPDLGAPASIRKKKKKNWKRKTIRKKELQAP